jgi:hypothetical protein
MFRERWDRIEDEHREGLLLDPFRSGVPREETAAMRVGVGERLSARKRVNLDRVFSVLMIREYIYSLMCNIKVL